MSKKQKSVHPGEILREEFLISLNISNYRLAKDLKISAGRVNNIVNEKCGISPDTAARMAVYFNTTVEFWLSLQMEYDLQCISDELKKTVEKEVKLYDLLNLEKAA